MVHCDRVGFASQRPGLRPQAGGRCAGTWRPTGPQEGPEDGRIGCSYGRAALLWVVWPHRPNEAIVAVRALRERYFLQLLLPLRVVGRKTSCLKILRQGLFC